MKAWGRVACIVCLLLILSGASVMTGGASLTDSANAMAGEIEDVPEIAANGVETNVTTDVDPPADVSGAPGSNASPLVGESQSDELTSSTDLPANLVPMQVVAPSNQELDVALLYGARVVIPEGTKYYASADQGGSGDYGVIGNRYTPMGTDLYIGGFSRLNDAQNIEHRRAYNPGDVPVAEPWDDGVGASWDNTWAVLFLDPNHARPLGWVPVRSIAVVNGILGDDKSNAQFQNGVAVIEKDGNDINDIPVDDDANPKPTDKKDGLDYRMIRDALEHPDNLNPATIDYVLQDLGNAIEDRIIPEQDAEGDSDNTPFISTREIAYAIEDYADNGDKVALLMDASGSVSVHMADIASYGAYIDKVNKADIIIAFAKKHQIISAEEYLNVNVDNRRTDIYTPLNELEDAASYDRIILVTDTLHNVAWVTLSQVAEFAGKIIVVCPNLSEVNLYIIQRLERAFNTTVYLCQLNNQLDQIQALTALGKVQAF